MMTDKVLRSAIASKLAYAQTLNKAVSIPHAMNLHTKYQMKDVCFINKESSGVQAYMWKNSPNSMLIAFKGSSTVSDIVNFLDWEKKEFRFTDRVVKVHSGVLRMFQSVEATLNDLLLDELGLDSKSYITFCGHSLGGALALFAAAYYGNVTQRNIKVSCHTFGAPKVGDKEFARWLIDGCDDVTNVVNIGDLVPLLPFGDYENDNSKIMVLGNHNSFIQDPLLHHDLETYIEFIREYFELLKTP
jgi:predicted lipase